MKKILLSSLVAIATITLLSGCTEEKKVAEVKPVIVEEKVVEVKAPAPVVVEVKTPEAALVDQVKESTSEVATKIAEESKKLAVVGTEAMKSVSEKVAAKTEVVVSKTQEVTKEVIAKAVETKDKIEESINTIVATKTDAKADDASLAEKGKGLFLKCAGCHGSSAEKPALGKSEIIKGWDKDKIVVALKGYKDDTYGGVMKGVMKGQVSNLSDEEIDALGAYIATF